MISKSIILTIEYYFDVRIEAMIKEQMFFTTVVQKLNQGTHPKTGCYRFRGAFFGTFLAKQKSTKNSLVIL